MNMRRILYMAGVVAPGLFVLLFTACPNPAASVSSTQHTISGVVADAITGEPIQGATVVMGKYSASTDPSGKYAITLDANDDSVTGAFAVSKGIEYGFIYIQSATLDASSDPSDFDIKLMPAIAPTASVTLSGTITDSNGSEIADGTTVRLDIVNQNGGASRETFSYSTGGYSVSTPTSGTSCFVVVALSYASGAPDVFYLKTQNITASSGPLDLQVPSTTPTGVSVGGAVSGADGGMVFVVPGYGSAVGYSPPSGSSFPSSLSVYNPDNFAVVWGQSAVDTSGSPSTVQFAISSSGALSSSATLPPFTLTPTTLYDDVTTAASGYNSGTLTFTPSSDPDVNLHFIQLVPQTSGGSKIGQMAGILWLAGGSATLPSSIQSVISAEIAATAGNHWGITAFAGTATGSSAANLCGFSTVYGNPGTLAVADFQLVAAAGSNSVVSDFIP